MPSTVTPPAAAPTAAPVTTAAPVAAAGPAAADEPRRDIRDLDAGALAAWFDARGEKAFRRKQLEQWLWQRGATAFAEMSNLGKGLRAKLAADFAIYGLREDARQVSDDGTVKVRFRLHDGHLVESVLIPVPRDDRYTVCVSSQVGCSLTCSFCATGKMARARNLTGAEIYDQVRLVGAICEATYARPLTNVVYMGMGEPLLAYAPVMRSIELLTAPWGLGMSPRRLTVSTAGIAKAIRRLAADQSKVNLALSLHAATEEKRSAIMPINDSNSLDVLLPALEEYYHLTRNRISYEYIALRGFNDTLDDAHALANLCRRFPVRVNIIEYNPVPGDPWHKSHPEVIDAFARVLRERGVMVTVRRSRGKDIDAACGQLANRDQG